MISMTGFTFAETQNDGLNLTLEIKSYNNRYLDISLNLPPLLSRWEPQLRLKLEEIVPRGRVELTIRSKDQKDKNQFKIHWENALEYIEALKELKKKGHLPGKVDLALVSLKQEIFTNAEERNPEDIWNLVEKLWPQAAVNFQNTRKTEGARMEKDIRAQLDQIVQAKVFIQGLSSTMEENFRTTLKRKFQDLAADVDENRVATETAVLLVRYGINEELVRLDSHISVFNQLLQEKIPVGKKLDFLCQEIGREVNTIGSKTTLAEVQQKVVTMKDSLENIREQLRNVE